MAQGTDPIRQDIDEIRGSMSEKLEEIESRVRGTVDSTVDNVRQTFDVTHQVRSRPWISLGLAIAAGYLLGSLGGDDEAEVRYVRPGQAVRYYPDDDDYERRASHERGSTIARQGRRLGGRVSRMAGPLGDEVQTIASAAVTSMVRTLRESMEKNVANFQAEYERARREREDREPAGEARAHEVGGTGI